MPATVNTDVNGWCVTCREWSVRGRHGQCMWCDTPLTDGPDAGGGRIPIPERALRALVADALDRMGEEAGGRREARERAAREAREARSRRGRESTPKRQATMAANGTRAGKPIGKHLLHITEDLIREAHELYCTGHDDQGKPLSVRKVAAIILPRTGYASDRAAAECLHKAWKVRGWPLRDRIEATRAAHLVHGELVGTKDWTDPEAKAKKNAYRARRRRRQPCSGRTKAGKPCPHYAQNGKDTCLVHDPERIAEVEAKLAAARLKRLTAAVERETERLAALERRAQETTTEGGPDGPRNHRAGHDDERPQEALAWLRGGARDEAA